MADFIPIDAVDAPAVFLPEQEQDPLLPLADDDSEEDPEELIFEEDLETASDHLSAGGFNDDISLPNDEVEVEEDALSSDSDDEPIHVDVMPPDSRPAYVNAFMPYVPLEHFANLAYAYVTPPVESPVSYVRQALQQQAQNPSVAVISSSHGAGLLVFASAHERELTVGASPFLGLTHNITVTHHDETNNRFRFDHSEIAALSIDDFPMEHWFPYHIFHSAAPFANPCEIDPICLTGFDYSTVLLTVKSRGSNDIPHALAVLGFSGSGTISPISIIHALPLPDPALGAQPPSPHDSEEGSNGSDDILADFPQPPFHGSHIPPPNADPGSRDRLVEMPGGSYMWGAF
jgi:hypothetical protein